MSSFTIAFSYKDASRSYVEVFVGLFIFLMAAVAVFGIIVDPYALFNIVEIDGFNKQKTCLERGGRRTIKSLSLFMQPYEVLIMGSSRVELGIDTNSPHFQGRKTFNAGLIGSNMWEIYRVGIFADRYQKVREVILGLDFESFSTKQNGNEDFEKSPLDGRFPLFSIFDRLLSLSAVRDCIQTVLDNRLGKPATYNKFGFREGDNLLREKENLNYVALFDETITDFLRKPEAYGDYQLGNDRMSMLRDLLERLARNHIRIYLFISPIHAEQMEAIHVAGLSETYDEWRHRVTGIVDEVKRDAGGRIELWDFSGYNSITSERVPEDGSGRRMKWYWESSHFTKEVGEMMLTRMLSPLTATGTVPSDFGVQLTPSNVEAIISADHTERALYVQRDNKRAANVARLHSLVKGN